MGELQKTFSLEDWTKAAQISTKLSQCINHREIMRKIHLCWYLTPNRLAHMKTDSSKFCWRSCGQVGSQLHIWWCCPITSHFWRQIENFITEVLGYNVALSPKLAVLDIHLADFPKSLRTVLQHILISARFVIAQHWNSPNPLPISEVIRRTNFHCHCETTLIISPHKCKLSGPSGNPGLALAILPVYDSLD